LRRIFGVCATQKKKRKKEEKEKRKEKKREGAEAPQESDRLAHRLSQEGTTAHG
jgi:hypothetical protein